MGSSVIWFAYLRERTWEAQSAGLRGRGRGNNWWALIIQRRGNLVIF